MPEILIRKMHAADVSEVVEIEHMSFTSPWSKAAFLAEILKLYSLTKVAVLRGKISGYICVEHIMDEGHILNLAVHPDFRRRGIGTKLMEEVMDELKKNDCRYLYLEVRVSNLGARKFYERRGFRVVGIRKCYYVSPIEDAALMMRGL
jgi:ribosomal-protein-alanine N-acetyltransferase